MGSIYSVCFSPDGNFFAAAGNENYVLLFNLYTGDKIRIHTAHTESITSLSFSIDGRYLFTGSNDNTIGLTEIDWELEFPPLTDWDDGAQPYLDIFLALHTPYGPDGLSRQGVPSWTEKDFQKLLTELQIRGYGWLRPEGVRRKLEELARIRGWRGE